MSEDPIRYAGMNANFFPYALNNPISLIDPTGLATVTNNTGSPILVYGNPGTGHGTNSPNVYGVVPSDGRTWGGADNPINSYATPQDAINAYYGNGPKPQPVAKLNDVDFYYPVPLTPNSTVSKDLCEKDSKKMWGDDLGPHYTLTRDKNGNVAHSFPWYQIIPAAKRRMMDDLNDYVDQHGPRIRYLPSWTW